MGKVDGQIIIQNVKRERGLPARMLVTVAMRSVYQGRVDILVAMGECRKL